MTPFQKRQIVLMRQMEAMLASGSRASTIVPMQTDYANDQQMCLTAVSFIPKEIAQTIQTTLVGPLSAITPNFYYYPDEALHVTIQNIRVIHNPPTFSALDIAKVQKLFAETISQTGPFRFVLTGLLSMPTSVSLIALIEPNYDRFVRQLRQALTDIHVPDDKHYFTDEMTFANITFCRYTNTPSPEFLQKLQNLKDTTIGNFTATEVSLITTNAGANPAKTRVLGTYRFA